MSSANPGYSARTPGRPSGWNPLTATFRTAGDGWITLVLLEPDRYWPSLCAHLGLPALVDDPRFADMPARATHADELHALLATAFAARTVGEWRAALATFDGPWEPFQSAADLHDDAQVLANDYLVDVEGGSHQLVAPPAQFDGAPPRPRRAPEPGEHTEQVLVDDLGLSWDDVSRLKADGTIQ
jgi:crotonobetainyl-CoA:carnitine CoA-transferase CaiB-like acyl-CoA transferase